MNIALAPAVRLPAVADDLSQTADILRFLRDALFAIGKEGESTSPASSRGLYALMTTQIVRLDAVVGEVTEAAAIVGISTTKTAKLDTLRPHNQ